MTMHETDSPRRQATTLLAISLCLLLAACSKDGGAGGKEGGKQKAMAFPVEVQPVETRDVEYSVSAVGSVEAFERVEVTARVSGVVERVFFSEGQVVSPGTVLAEIEPERYRIAVDSAQANVERAQAELEEAKAGYARRQAASAKNPGLIRGEEVETWRTKVSTATAEVSQARAALEQAKLNLRDALLRAPVGGVIQTRTVQTGQYVQPGGVLATLERRDPLLLRFQVPEQESVRVHPGMTARFTVGSEPQAYSAKITHVAASANVNSRMVAMTANIDDVNKTALKPGAFARVTIPIGSTIAAPVVPQTAIRPSEKGFLAYIVYGGVAKERILTLGMRTADGAVEVKNGLAAGDKLVIRGAEALRDGAPVKIVTK